MHENAAVRAAYEFGPKTREVNRPNFEFIHNLHHLHGVELDALPGLNAMTRPYDEQQRTIGEIYYELDDPAEVMELNRTVMNVWLYDLISGEKTPEELRAAYEDFTHNQKHDVLTFNDFVELKQIVDNAIPPEMRGLFRAMLIYSDLGKSTRMQEFMKENHGRTYADHDKLLIDVLDDDAAIMHCMPSFRQLFTEDQQQIIKACFKSGFHLGQYQKLETLPSQLIKMQQLPSQLQDMIMLTGLFDIAGSLGDKVQDGTPVLNHATFKAFKQARESVQVRHPDADSGDVDPVEQALYSYELYLEARNEEFGLDLTTREGRACARFACMFRVLKPEEIKGMPAVFENQLGEITQQLFVELLDATGFEKNALWIEYGPALARNLYKAMRDSKCSYELAMSMAMTTLARIANVTRKEGSRRGDGEGLVTVMVSKLAHAVQGNGWPRIIENLIKISPAEDNLGEFTATLEPVPEIFETKQNAIRQLNHLRNETGVTLAVGVGGGSDCAYARFAMEALVGDLAAPVVSFPGVRAEDIRGADRIADTVYLATPQTHFEGKRSFERFAVREGSPCYIIVDVEKQETKKLHDAYQIIARHIEETLGAPVTQVVTIDSGGDIMEQPSSSWNRDIESLRAAETLEKTLGIEKSHTLVLVPGVDAPDNINEIAKMTDAKIYTMKDKDAAVFIQECDRNDLPSSHPSRYSQMIDMGYYACLPHKRYGVQPLHLPPEQALGNNRPAYGVTKKSMRQVVVIDNAKLRAYHVK